MPRINKLWFDPEPVPVNATKFEFGFTDHSGEKRHYQVAQKGTDRESFVGYVFELLKVRRKNWIDWPTLKKLSVDLKPVGKTIQEELPLKVAHSFLTKNS
jgi:hypothetical protein